MATPPAQTTTTPVEHLWNVTFFKPGGIEDDVRETTFNCMHIQSLRSAFHNTYGMDPMSVLLKYKKPDETKITMNSDDDLSRARALTDVNDKHLNVYVVPNGNQSNQNNPSTGENPSLALRWEHLMPVGTTRSFMVPMEELSLNDLKKACELNSCALVQGSFRTGKTSHCFALRDHLNSLSDYYCVYIPLSLDVALDEDGRNLTFTKMVMTSLYSSARKYLLPDIDLSVSASVQDVLSMFKRKAGGRKLVILWDEFQLLVAEDAKQVREAITEACRHGIADNSLFCSLGFGTFDTEFLSDPSITTTNLSPFHRETAIHMKPATPESMRRIIAKCEDMRGEKFSQDVIDAWIHESGGFLGVFSLIGDVVNQRAIGHGGDRGKWPDEYRKVWLRMGDSSGSFTRLASSVTSAQPSTKQKIRSFMVADLSIEMKRNYNDKVYKDLITMASAGIFLRRSEGEIDSFTVSCSAVRHLVLHLFSSGSPLPLPDQLFKRESHKELVKRLMKQLVTESVTLQNTLCHNRDGFPSEVTFQGLIYSDIKLALSEALKIQYCVLMETAQRTQGEEEVHASKKQKPGPSKRSDLLVKNGDKILIELKSNALFTGILKDTSMTSDRRFEDALSQVVAYAKAQEMEHGILLNIVSSSSAAGFRQVENMRDGVTIYVYQVKLSADFSTFTWILQDTLFKK